MGASGSLHGMAQVRDETGSELPCLYFHYASQAADLILDAPSLPSNFYLNLLDWSCRNIVPLA